MKDSTEKIYIKKKTQNKFVTEDTFKLVFGFSAPTMPPICIKKYQPEIHFEKNGEQRSHPNSLKWMKS
jgi:hypothetical protein